MKVDLPRRVRTSTLVQNAGWMFGGYGVRIVIQGLYFVLIARDSVLSSTALSLPSLHWWQLPRLLPALVLPTCSLKMHRGTEAFCRHIGEMDSSSFVRVELPFW